MRVISVLVSDVRRLYLIDNGFLADFCYADNEWVVWVKQDPDVKSLIPMAIQNRVTREILDPAAYTDEIKEAVEKAVKDFVA